jgi:hypothetical protein
MEDVSMRFARYRHVGFACALALSLLAAAPAFAVNDTMEQSCDPDCSIKPPKEALFIRSTGDLDANGASPVISGTLKKGQKNTVVRVDLTYEWFSLNNQFRSLVVKINNKFPVNFVILNHLSSCGPGSCVVHATYWFDINQQEAVYPTEFIGQPLNVALQSSAKVADANSSYNATLAIQVVKKK